MSQPDMSQSNASSSNDDLSTITTKYSDDISRTKDNMEKGKRNGRKNKKKGGASKAEKEREKKMKKREAMKMHYSRKSDEEKKEVSRKNNNQARLRRAGENPDQQSLVQAEVNSKRRRIYAANVDAKLWNDKFPYDKIADNQRDRNETEKVVVFGMETSLHLRIPERVKTMTQHLPYVRDGLGHCDEGGHFVETTGASLVRVAKAVDRAIFHGDVRNRCLVSLDAGSGNGYPSMVFSQLFDKGFHIGAELCPGLVANSMSNLKALTAKGVVNLMDGKLDKEQVEQFGELAHNVPPRAFFVHGNLEAIEHLGGFDFVYGFDAVNSWETKLAMANAWNHPKSRRCMVVVSNSTEAEMEALGYKDIIFKEGVRVQFRTSGNESRVAHVYKRKSLRKCRHKYSFESPNAETCPMFAKAFELYRKGDEVARMTFTGYKKNTLLFDANLGSDPYSLMPQRGERRNRRGLPATVNYSAEDNASLSTMES